MLEVLVDPSKAGPYPMEKQARPGILKPRFAQIYSEPKIVNMPDYKKMT
jgi:hypothetical protein